VATSRLGINAKGYYRSSGSFGSPTWTVVDRIADATITHEWEEVKIADRGIGVSGGEKGLGMLEVSGRVRVNEADAGYLALYASFLSRALSAAIDMMFLNGPKDSDGARGVRALWNVLKWSEPQQMADGIYRE
jgi:hypothetical protein